MPKVFITSPSLLENENVSGISSLVSGMMFSRPGSFTHVLVGSKDLIKTGFLFKLFSCFAACLFIFQNRSEHNIIHINTAGDFKACIRDLFITLFSKSIGIKVVLHLHGGRWLTFVPVFKNKPIDFMVYQWLLNAGDAVIFLGKGQAQSVDKILINKNNVYILDNFINLPKQTCLKDKLSFLYLGRIEKNKGVLLLPEIMYRVSQVYPNSLLRVAGSGNDLQELLNSLHGFGVKHEYLGVVSGMNKFELLAKSEFFLLPSFFEGLPISLLEAIFSGCIPITSDVGEMKDIVSVSGGASVSGHNIDDYVNEIVKLVSQGKRFIDYSIIKQKYSDARFFDQLDKVYKSIL